MYSYLSLFQSTDQNSSRVKPSNRITSDKFGTHTKLINELNRLDVEFYYAWYSEQQEKDTGMYILCKTFDGSTVKCTQITKEPQVAEQYKDVQFVNAVDKTLLVSVKVKNKNIGYFGYFNSWF